VAAVALLAGVAASAQQSAQAYPPGIKLSLQADRQTVPVTQKVTLTASHVGPGCSVMFTFGSQRANAKAQAGTASATFQSRVTSGVIKAEASTFGCAFHETAFTTIKASSPAIRLPAHVVARLSFKLTIYQFPALMQIKVRVYNGHFSKTVEVKTGSGGTAAPVFEVPTAGSYLVVASGGQAFASIVLQANHH
jgi:hypothetical protein